MIVGNLKPKIVFLTGAGLSADSGIPTYRGPGGFYEGMHAEEVMSARTFRQKPEVIHRFCDDRRVSLGNAEPNEAHHMIKRIADKYGDQVIHLTQNIDDLSERAGLSNTFHLHGELRVLHSLGCPDIEVDIGFRRYWSGDIEQMPADGFKFKCPKTGTLFRPHVVLFGEEAPHYRTLQRVVNSLREHDIFIVIGTQGRVIDVDHYVRFLKCKTILNNLHDSLDINHNLFGTYLKMNASKAAPLIEEAIERHMHEMSLWVRVELI